jgi:hypothetical protein
MALKASNVVGDSVTLHRIWWIFMVRRIDDLVLGTPGNRLCLWPSTSKQGSGVGHTGIRGWKYLKCILGLGMAIIKASSSRLMRRSWDHHDVS